MRTKLSNLLKPALLIGAVMCCFSCQKPQLTHKDLVNAYTIGWHQGYSQGKQICPPEQEDFWLRTRWIQDSCLFENSIWAIKQHITFKL